MSDDAPTTESGRIPNKGKLAKDLNEVIRYTLWSVFKLKDVLPEDRTGYDRDQKGPVSADAYLRKPFRMEALERILGQVLP